MHAPVTLDTIAALHRYGHGMRAICPRCRRDVMLDLAEMIRRGLGERAVVGMRLRCSNCGSVGQGQLRVPLDAWPTHLRPSTP
jgi:hypothetical protein